MAKQLPFYIREDDPPAKREILRAAMELFSARGLAATSIRDIAHKSGYTNPALYKHFASKEEMEIHLFETCHRRVWASCAAALGSAKDFQGKLEAYVGRWLELVDEYPDVMAFLSDSARVLWPKAGPRVRQRTMVSLARSLAAAAPETRRRASALNLNVAAASLQGTLAELARMIQVGVIEGPAKRWKTDLVELFGRLIA